MGLEVLWNGYAGLYMIVRMKSMLVWKAGELGRLDWRLHGQIVAPCNISILHIHVSYAGDRAMPGAIAEFDDA